MDSVEKDPTCVIDMLHELLPASRRAAIRRGTAVATRLEFEESSTTSTSNNRLALSTKRRALSTFSSVEKKLRTDTDSSAAVPPSPWDYRLLKGDFVKAKARIESLENLVKQLHSLRREQETVFENEKISITSNLESKEKLICDLQSRIEVLTRRNVEARDSLAEYRSEANSAKQNAYIKLLALEKENAELKGAMGQQKLTERSNDVGIKLQLTQLQTELDSARQHQADYEKRVQELEAKLIESNKSNREAEILSQAAQAAETRANALLAELEEGRETVATAARHQAKLAKMPEMERELERLRDDNTRLRSHVHNKLMLEEKVASLSSRLAHSDERDRELARTTSLLRTAEASLAEWTSMARAAAGARQSPADVRAALERLQQRELQLTAEVAEAKSRLRVAAEAKNALASEIEGLKSLHEKQNGVIEMHKNYTRRINKRLQLVSSERNSYRSQLDAYERELTMPLSAAGGGAQGDQQRARIESLENALDGYRELVERLEKDNVLDKEMRMGAAGTAAGQPTERVSALESEKEALTQENEELKRKLEEMDLENKFRAFKGDFNMGKSKVLHYRQNPQAEACAQRVDELRVLRAECTRLRERVRVLKEGQASSSDLTLIVDERLKTSNSQEVTDLRAQVKSFELKLQRLKEAFKATSNEIREVVYTVLGFRIDRKTSQEYHLSSMYAESPDDILIFKYNETGELDMIATPFSNTLTQLIDLHLTRQQSIPVFLSAVTIDLFSQQTMCTVTEPTLM